MKELNHLFENQISESFKNISHSSELISNFFQSDFQEQIRAAFKIPDQARINVAIGFLAFLFSKKLIGKEL